MSVISFSLVMVFVGIWLVVMAGLMALMGFGLWRMCKNAGMPRAWISFIYPVYNISRLAERSIYTATGKRTPLSKWSIWLLWASLGVVALVFLVLIFSLFAAMQPESMVLLMLLIMLPCFALAIASAVLIYYGLYYVYKDYIPGNETLMLILSVVLGAYPIVLLVIMNVKPVSVAGRGEFGQPRYI